MRKKTKAKIKRLIINVVTGLLFGIITSGAVIYIICNLDKFTTIYR